MEDLKQTRRALARPTFLVDQLQGSIRTGLAEVLTLQEKLAAAAHAGTLAETIAELTPVELSTVRLCVTYAGWRGQLACIADDDCEEILC